MTASAQHSTRLQRHRRNNKLLSWGCVSRIPIGLRGQCEQIQNIAIGWLLREILLARLKRETWLRSMKAALRMTLSHLVFFESHSLRIQQIHPGPRLATCFLFCVVHGSDWSNWVRCVPSAKPIGWKGVWERSFISEGKPLLSLRMSKRREHSPFCTQRNYFRILDSEPVRFRGEPGDFFACFSSQIEQPQLRFKFNLFFMQFV